MGTWNHPIKEWRALLRRVEANGWDVERPKGGGYIRCRCDCGEHSKRVPYSPSSNKSLLNVTKWFERQPCWKDEQ